jgi:ribosomal-protein-alanine N-acetyltransferase
MTHLIPATIAHAPVLAAVHEAVFPPGERWSTSAMAEQLALPGTFALLALSSLESPCGLVLARVAADEAEILTLGVTPVQRRQGAARLLLQEAEHRAAQAGAVAMFLEVAEGNAAARLLYGGCGYREVGRRPRYYLCGADALVLKRGLTPAAATAC